MYWLVHVLERSYFRPFVVSFLKNPKLCSFLPGAGAGAGAVPKEAGSETLARAMEHKNNVQN